MKIKELFIIGDPVQSIRGFSTYLDHNNCVIENKIKRDNTLVLLLKRHADNEEGRAYLRVLGKFSEIEPQLLSWAFPNNGFIGLTLNQLGEMETDLDVHVFNKKMMLSRKE